MKTIVKLAAAMALMSLAACNKDDVNTPAPAPEVAGVEVQFDMQLGAMSRTVTSESGELRLVDWRNADAVGIFVNETGEANQYVYDGSWKGASEDDVIYVETGKNYKFHSYYPYNESVVAEGLSLKATVAADQNTVVAGSNTGYDLSDVLIASTDEIDGESASNVTMNFSHIFSMVEVIVTGNQVTAAPAEVKLCNVKSSATVDLAAGTVALDAASSASEIIMYSAGNTADGWLYRAIVPAQTIAADSVILEVKLAGGKAYEFTAPAKGLAYKQARYRRIVATLSEDISLTFPAGSIDSWGPSDALAPSEGKPAN